MQKLKARLALKNFTFIIIRERKKRLHEFYD